MHNDDDIVITGMACRFADTADPVAMWKNIVSGKASFSQYRIDEFEKDELLPFGSRPPGYLAALDRLYAYVSDETATSFERKPGENGDVFFILQMISDALADSGLYARDLPSASVALHLGYASPFNATAVSWLQRTYMLDETVDLLRRFIPGLSSGDIGKIRLSLRDALPELSPGALGSSFGGALVSNIAERLHIDGPAETVDAGFVSGHCAIRHAADDLRAGRADVAVAGAVQPPVSPMLMFGLSGFLHFTRDSHPRPYCKDATGTLPGEGGALFVLKRRSDAKKAGDRIYAVVEHIATKAPRSDFRLGSLNPANLASTMRTSLDAAKAHPSSVRMIEACACAVPEIDAAEIATMRDIFDGVPGERVGVGSVSCNIGHTLIASSAAGVVKAALALSHKVLPPSMKIERMNAKNFGSLYWLDEARPWLNGDRKNPRRAFVNAIDYTGTCATMLLSE